MKIKKLKKLSLVLTCITIIIFSLSFSGKFEKADASTVLFSQGEQYEQGLYDLGNQSVASNWTNISPYGGPTKNQIKWSTANKTDFANGFSLSQPVIADDGTIYATGSIYVYAINPDGGLKWKNSYTQSGTNNRYSPAVASDGTIYVVCGDLIAINPDGTLKWKYHPTSGVLQGNPTITKSGNIIVHNDTGSVGVTNLLSIHPSGSLAWSTKTIDKISQDSNGFIISSDGTIYFLNASREIEAYDTNGNFKWKYRIDTTLSSVTGNIVIGAEGLIYVGAKNLNFVTVLNADGTINKKINLPSNLNSYITLDNEGVLYVSCTNGIKAIKPDGTLKYSYGSGLASATLRPIIDKNGVLYTAIGQVGFVGINPDGTEKWRINYDNSNDTVNGFSPTLAKDGTLYYFHYDYDSTPKSTLIAINDPNPPLENICTGYLEDLEAKIKAGTVTDGEIQNARYRLIKDLQNLNELEQGKAITQ